MRRLPRQPLLWFVVIGGLLFIIDSLYLVDRNEIHVSAALENRLGLLWQTQTGLVASPEELDSLVNNWIEEEVLYQEALRLGLDQEDSIIRRRLVQKLNFIAESEPSIEPETATLQAYYSDHIEAYTLPIRYSFRQLYFSQRAAAGKALEQIIAGADFAGLGEASMLSPSYAFRSALDINATFGFGFTDQINPLQTNSWQGPLQSGFGFHLLYLTALHSQEITPFPAIEQQVRMDYQEYQKENARQLYLERLLEQYRITVESR